MLAPYSYSTELLDNLKTLIQARRTKTFILNEKVKCSTIKCPAKAISASSVFLLFMW